MYMHACMFVRLYLCMSVEMGLRMNNESELLRWKSIMLLSVFRIPVRCH